MLVRIPAKIGGSQQDNLHTWCILLQNSAGRDDLEQVPDNIEFVIVSIAILHPVDASSIRSAVAVPVDEFASIIRGPLNITTAADRVIISSNRDQIEIQIYANKLDVRDLSGKLDHAFQMLPRVLHETIRALPEFQAATFGINFVIEVDLEDPQSVMAGLVNPDIQIPGATSLRSNTISLKYESGPKYFTAVLSIDKNQVLSVNFNASEDKDMVPDQNDLESELSSSYSTMTQFNSAIGVN